MLDVCNKNEKSLVQSSFMRSLLVFTVTTREQEEKASPQDEYKNINPMVKAFWLIFHIIHKSSFEYNTQDKMQLDSKLS